MTRRSHPLQLGSWLCPSILLAAQLLATPAQAQIDRPGAHERYGLEVSPHLVIQWHDEPPWDDDAGLGAGVHVSVPLLDNGPVTTINNSLAITFGLDAGFFDDACPNFSNDCDGFDLWFPVAAQWNFYFASEFSMFMELGLGFEDESDGDWECAGGRCDTDSDLDVELVLWVGARYHIYKSVALRLQLGSPSVLLGASFFM